MTLRVCCSSAPPESLFEALHRYFEERPQWGMLPPLLCAIHESTHVGIRDRILEVRSSSVRDHLYPVAKHSPEDQAGTKHAQASEN